MKHGFIKLAAAVPEIYVAAPEKNLEEILRLTKEAAEKGVHVLCFPELSLTGCTCGDLFLHDTLLNGAEEGLRTILEATKNLDMITVLGMPVRGEWDNKLYNCAVIIQNGDILGVVPKANLSDYGEANEKRWFTPAPAESDTITLLDKTVPFGTDLVFRCVQMPELALGFEICQDVVCLRI